MYEEPPKGSKRFDPALPPVDRSAGVSVTVKCGRCGLDGMTIEESIVHAARHPARGG